MKKTLHLLLLLLITAYGQAQTGDTLIRIKQLGWSLRLPRTFVLVSDKENQELTDKGKSAIEKSTDVQVDMTGLVTLLSASQGEFNYISATIQAFNPEEDGDYMEVNEGVKAMLYKTFTDQMPGGKVDTSSSRQVIDGIEFARFNADISADNKKIMTMVMLYKLYKGYDFGITYVYVDDKARITIEKMLSDSKFEK